MIRHNTDLLGSIDEQMPDEEVRKHLLELNEDQHDEKREALAVFNNKVETLRMSCVATTTETLGRFRCLRMSILCVQCILAGASSMDMFKDFTPQRVTPQKLTKEIREIYLEL